MATERWRDDPDLKPPRHQSMVKMVPAAWFVWEDTPGLDHHCPVCGVPNSHAGTLLNICLGEHVMPCPKYHQNLFWPNKTHECDPCNRSREEHFKRHKAVATSLRDLERLTSPSDSPPSPSLAFGTDWAESDGATQQRCRKENKLAKKLDKALSRKPPPDTITSAGVARVALAFHPDEGGDEDFIELDDPDFPEDLVWDKRGYAWYRREVDLTGTVIPPDFDELAAAALRRLGVELPSHRQRLTKDQRAITNQLFALARADLEHLWNEEVETAKRRGGFLRFMTTGALSRIKDSRRQRLEHATRQRRADEVEQVPGHVEEEVPPPEDVLNHPAAEPVRAPSIDFPVEEQVEADAVPLPQDGVAEEEAGPTVFNSKLHSDHAEPKKQEDEGIEHVVALPKPQDMPLPRPDKKELVEWEIEANKAKFRRTLSNAAPNPRAQRYLDAKDFFQAGVYNMFNHDIWAIPRDTPLEPRPDPEEQFIDTDNMHQADALHPRHDDWKAFTKHFRRYKPHPWQTARYDGHKPVDYTAPAKLSAARVVVPMGEEVYMTEQKRVEEITTAISGGAPGCPDGHVCMMMHSTIVPFAFDAAQLAPAYLVDRFSRGDGFLAEQCWQHHLIGRLNQQNLALRDGLRRKRDLALYDSGLAVFTPLDAEQLAQLEGPLNDARVPRTCVCHGIQTTRMVACDNIRCANCVPMHARCMDVDYAPAEGERHFCNSCAADMLWFLCEERVKQRAAAAVCKLPAAADERDSPAVAELVCRVLRLMHSQTGPRLFERFVPVEVVTADVVGTVDACADQGVAPPHPRDMVSRILAERTYDGRIRSQERSFLEFCDACAGEEGRFTRYLPERTEKNVKVSAVRMLNRDSGQKGKAGKAQDDGEKGEAAAESAEEERAGERVKFELEWEALDLGPDARRLYRSDPVQSAESVVRWEKLIGQPSLMGI